MKKNKGFSLIELLIVIIVVGVIAAIAVPNLLASRRSANGVAAMQAMRVFHSAQSTYQAGVGSGEFGNITDLAKQDLIDSALADATTSSGVAKSGYKFILNTTNNSAANLADFNVVANAFISSGVNKSGDRSFYVDSTGVIRASSTAATPANSTDFPVGN